MQNIVTGHALALNGAIVRACAENDDHTLTLPVPAVDGPHVGVELCLDTAALKKMAAVECDAPTTYFVEPSFAFMQMLAKSVCSGDIHKSKHDDFFIAVREYSRQQFAARRWLAADVASLSTASLPPAPVPGDSTMPKWTSELSHILDNSLNQYVHCTPLLSPVSMHCSASADRSPCLLFLL